MTELLLLGGLDVRSGLPEEHRRGLTQPKRLALLTYLVLAEPAGLQSRDTLLAMFWPDADDTSSRHSLRNALYALRRVLGDDAIITRGESYVGIAPGAIRCDALELRAHLHAGRVEDAIALWRGELAPGFNVSGVPEFERWLDQQRSSLREALRSAAWKRADALAGQGQPEIDAVRRACHLDPADEKGARRLMRLLVQSGDRGAALRAYRQLADYFARELETAPSDETRAIAAELQVMPLPPSPSDALPPDLNPAMPAPAHTAPRRPRRRIGYTLAAGAGLILLGLTAGALLTKRPATVSEADNDARRAALFLPARYRSDTASYSSYLRGLTLRLNFHILEARDTFAALVDRAPLYVPGLCGLAHSYNFVALGQTDDPDDAWLKSDALARRAIALDSNAACGWLALAGKNMFADGDFAQARANITRAEQIEPTDPDGPGLEVTWFRFHAAMDSALLAARRAHRLEPLSNYFTKRLARELYLTRRYDESLRVYGRLLRDAPTSTRAYGELAELYFVMGRPRDAVEWYRRLRLSQGDSAGAALLPPAGDDGAARTLLAADARRTVQLLDSAVRAGRRANWTEYARSYARLGDTMATLDWLDSLSAHHDSYLHHVRVEPIFDFVRTQPRYRVWEASTGLPPMAGQAGGQDEQVGRVHR